MFKVYAFPKTRSTRVQWALEELGEKYDVVPIDLTKGEHKKPEYLKIHPQGKVPALSEEGRIIFESAAIVAYLADKFQDKKLAPPISSFDRGIYYQWLFFAMTELEKPVLNYYFHTERFEPAKRDPNIVKESQEKFMLAATVVENALKGRNYLLGDQFTAADILVGSMVLFAERLGLLSSFSGLQAYAKRLTQRPAYQRAMG